MSTYRLSTKSKTKLQGVHPLLNLLVREAIKDCKVDFTVLEGLRTIQTQRAYLKRGVTWTLNSKHLSGNAIDLVPIDPATKRLSWAKTELFDDIHVAMDKAIEKYNVKGVVRNGKELWGKDLAHWQISEHGFDARNMFSGKTFLRLTKGKKNV